MMHLYSMTLQRASAISCAAYGNFSGPREQEFVVGRGEVLELLRPDDTGKVQTICSAPCFSLVRSVHAFRLMGEATDKIVVGSDGGNIVVLQYNKDTNRFDKLHDEVFGKTGCRRITPGQYLAKDPAGRAILIGAVEKQKLVYVMNRDAAGKMTISSPLEAHKSHTILFDVVGLDVGFNNPTFACLELGYQDADADPTGEAAAETEKMLTYYELDLGLNNVTRKWTEPIDRGANGLITVPGGEDGPGGVLVLAENMVVYKHEGHAPVRTPIPRRIDMPDERGLLITSHATHKQKGLFFFMLQSELGDLYKVTLDYTGETVHDVRVQYFDSVPPAISLCITKTGFLFLAAEFANHFLFQFESLGDDDDTAVALSIKDGDEEEMVPVFKPRKLTNLAPVDEIQSIAPSIDMQVGDLAHEGGPQIYTLCGRGPRSTLRVLRHGVAVSEIAVSDMPGNPVNVWTLKSQPDDEYHKMIIVSFGDATLVLSVGESVQQVADSGFNTEAPTLSTTLLDNGKFIQVCPTVMMLIKYVPNGEKTMMKWAPGGGKQIIAASCNSRQIVVALQGGEIVYFSLNEAGDLSAPQWNALGVEIAAVAIGDVPEGRRGFDKLAVADINRTVRILSLDPENMFDQLSTQALKGPAESLAFARMSTVVAHPDAKTAAAADGGAGSRALYLFSGLQNGLLQRTEVDEVTGGLRDTRDRFLGPRPVRLRPVPMGSSMGVMAMSARTWICHMHQGSYKTSPLSYDPLVGADAFNSEVCPGGIVAVSGGTLRIFTVDDFSEIFNQQIVPTRYTPRKCIVHPQSGYLISIESDHNAFNEAEQEAIKQAYAEMEAEEEEAAGSGGGAEEEGEADEEEHPERRTGVPIPGEPGKWASCIRVFDPTSGEFLDTVELPGNQAAFSIAPVELKGELFILVGTVKDMTMHPRKHNGGFVHVYRMLDAGKKLQFVNETEVPDIPYAIAAYQNRVVIGIGQALRLCDLGSKKLLRKCELQGFPSMISNIHVQGERLYVADATGSMHYVKFDRTDQQFVIFADDIAPRHVTASCVLDYDKVVVGDKFGNIAVLRLPADASDDVDNPTGNQLLWDAGMLNGAPNKLQQICQTYIGSAITSIRKTKLTGGHEIIVYMTITGALGALVPLASRDDMDFFVNLEMYLRSERNTLLGRNQLHYRSYYIPVKEVSDGDFCETFAMLPAAKQKSMADDLDRTPAEVLKKLELMRNQVL